MADMDGQAWELRGRLGLEEDWIGRWDSLSHGERKRAQIAVALWRRPSVLAIDEPTNHLDREARRMLAEALRRYDGIGLLVSHDRELLDELCRQCVFVEPPVVTVRPGGYTQGVEQARLEQEAARRQREVATRQVKRLEREVGRRRTEAARSDARRSKKNLGKDNDARFKRNLARMSGKDGQAGRLLNQLSGRAEQAVAKRDQIRVKKEHDLGIWVQGARSPRDRLLWRDAGSVAVGGGRRLLHPDLVMRPDDRVALTGPNGGGKSTLWRALLEEGMNVDPERLVYVPQEIDKERSRRLLEAARASGRAVGAADDGGELSELAARAAAGKPTSEPGRGAQAAAGRRYCTTAASDRHGRADQPPRSALDRMSGAGPGRLSVRAAAGEPRRAVPWSADAHAMGAGVDGWSGGGRRAGGAGRQRGGGVIDSPIRTGP